MRALLSRNIGTPDCPMTVGEFLQSAAVLLATCPALLWVGAWLRSAS